MNKFLIFLTSCVNPLNGIPSTVIVDFLERKDHYITTINWYLNNTTFDIAIIDNSGFNWNEYIEDKDKHRFVIVDYFLPENFELKKGKGYGEGLIISRLASHKQIFKYDFIIKISGRHIVENINMLIYPYYFFYRKKYVSAIWDYKNNFAVTDFFLFSPSFLTDIFIKRLNDIDESKNLYIEHILSESIKTSIHSFRYKYIFLLQPLIQVGYSGTTGAKLQNKPCLKSRCAFLKNFIVSICCSRFYN